MNNDGASQLYKRQYVKGTLVDTSTVALFTFAGIKSSIYQEELNIFNRYKEDYENAFTKQEALQLGDLADKWQNLVSKMDNHRKFLIISGLLVYAYNIYDGLTSKPNGGYAKKDKDLEFYLSQE